MILNTLEEKCEYYRSLTDYRLMPNGYVLVMIDGRSFSTMVKNKFKRPFDERFIEAMNLTAEYVARNVQGCRFGYVQSDEASFLLQDNLGGKTSEAFFHYRLCKMQSIIASMATARFNQLMFAMELHDATYNSTYGKDGKLTVSPEETVLDAPLYQFDCKAWTVPSRNDAFAWFLYRQLDCIRNSKQQAAQTYIPHKELEGFNTDQQIDKLKETTGIDWNTDYTDGMKYGRFIYREKEKYRNEMMGVDYIRSPFKVHDAFELHYGDNREKFEVLYQLSNGLVGDTGLNCGEDKDTVTDGTEQDKQ